MEWVLASPGLAGAVAVLMFPGVLVGWALGLRHVWLISLAPVLTASLVAVSTIVCWWLRIDWNIGVFTVAATLLAGTVLLVMRGMQKRWPASFAWEPSGYTAGVAYWSALSTSALLLTLRYIQIVERPGNINQGIDTPFHVNFTQQILDSGDGSPFSVRALMGESSGFYPQIWHALTALTAQVAQLPVVEAANALNYAIVAVAWPLGVLLLVHMVAGPNIIALLSAAVASAGFFAFPFTVMQSQKSDFGPLFPYMLAVTFLPPLTAVLAMAMGFGKAAPMPWPLAAFTMVVGIPGLVSTHMSGLVALVGLSSIFAAMAAWRAFRELKQRQSDLLGYLKWTALWITVFFGALIVWVVVRPWTTTWDPIDSLPAAAGSILLTAPTHGDIAWALAALTLVGTALLIRRPAERWFLASYGGAVLLYLVAAAVPAAAPLVREIIIGAWYGDPPRLAALLPMFWAVLVGVAAAWIFQGLSRYRTVWLVPTGIAAVAASILVWPTNSETTPGRERTYALAESSPLLSPDELQLLNRLSSHVPADAVIANNPWDGSSTAYAIADRRVLFAHAYTGSNKDRILAAKKLNEASPGSEVCVAADREDIQFVLDFGEHYIDPKRKEVDDFPGIEIPKGSPSFVKVDQQGDAALYRFVGCDY
ncbi:DUF6541 family protein [Pseudarthrobacter quantipunctorum]|uniref:DUF6541 family protein n=1 Tax=Pseudarthrobacter quantipunctorum TaxID=3128980 RepID=A0ABZ2R830_9MICC